MIRQTATPCLPDWRCFLLGGDGGRARRQRASGRRGKPGNQTNPRGLIPS